MRDDLPGGLNGEPTGKAAIVGRTLDELEQQAILEALSETGGRQDRAARMLGHLAANADSQTEDLRQSRHPPQCHGGMAIMSPAEVV